MAKACALLFPGQGAQVVGMGSRAAAVLPSCRLLFDAASEILGYDLLGACTRGPQALLDSTAVCQPAILVSSLAAVELLAHEHGEGMRKADVACGLSLGEYSALVYAGALQFEDAVKVVRARGEAMQAASEMDGQPSAMISVVGVSESEVLGICCQASAAGSIGIANYLSPTNFTLSGGIAACEQVEAMCAAREGLRTSRLPVSGGFHSEYMHPACDALRLALEAVPLECPRLPVLSNVDALPHGSPDEMRGKLLQQLTAPVQWDASMRAAIDRGVTEWVAVGPGKSTASLLKRISRRAKVTCVEP